MVDNGICSVVGSCGMCSLSGLLIGIFSELVMSSMFLSSGVVCVGGIAFWFSACREEVVIVSEGVVTGGIVGSLGEARPSVVESSEYDGVVGSIGAWIGPWIYSCGGVSWGLFGFCSTCVVSSCSCNVDGEGWPVSDDDGACWHHGHIRNGSSSMPICFLHI